MTATQDTLLTDDEPETTPAPLPPTSTFGLLTALKAHYRKPGTPRDGCILITEAQAPGSLRRCDLIHIGVASRGRGIDAHEIKASRSDWLRELAEPAKADAWWPYCSTWWIVAPPGVVLDGELPPGWGLMEPSGRRRFRIRAEAVAKEPQLTLALLAELLARADNERLTEMQILRDKHANDLFKQAEAIRREQVTRTLDHATRSRLELLEKVETAIGVPIHEYAWTAETPATDIRPEELAVALADVRGRVDARRLLASTEKLRDQLRAAAGKLLESLDGAS